MLGSKVQSGCVLCSTKVYYYYQKNKNDKKIKQNIFMIQIKKNVILIKKLRKMRKIYKKTKLCHKKY